MMRRTIALGVVTGGLLAAASHSGFPVAAQSARQARPQAPPQPRTSWGDPDLQGVWYYATMTPLERPREFADKAVLSEAEAAEYERQTIERRSATNQTAGQDWWDLGTRTLIGRRTSLIVDPANGRVPALTQEAQQAVAARAQARRGRDQTEGPEERALNERCLMWATAGPPMLPGVYNNTVQFVQTPHTVVIVNEMIHDARIVPTDGRPHGSMRRWMGDSTATWDHGTLVVDTVNFSSKNSFRGASDRLHLVERFTRVDAATLTYEFTVDDPATWVSTWTVSYPMTRSTGLLYEYACHEGNARSMIGMLEGARSEERRR